MLLQAGSQLGYIDLNPIPDLSIALWFVPEVVESHPDHERHGRWFSAVRSWRT
jgi:hypothetical protein